MLAPAAADTLASMSAASQYSRDPFTRTSAASKTSANSSLLEYSRAVCMLRSAWACVLTFKAPRTAAALKISAISSLLEYSRALSMLRSAWACVAALKAAHSVSVFTLGAILGPGGLGQAWTWNVPGTLGHDMYRGA